MDAPGSTSQPQASQVGIPKENSPPPAYTPRRAADRPAIDARTVQARHILASLAQAQAHDRSQQQQAPFATLLPGAVCQEQDEPAGEEGSPISLRINTSVNVSRSNNIICLTATPAEQANAIARAVVQALHEGSSGRCGIPMIDEQGCPRPLRIEVDAGLVVEGTGNVVGTRDIVSELLRRRADTSLRRPREDDDEEHTSAKRRRSSP
ncbi:hypothetical protein FZEAL_1113 [Fusarium zealandicum]|uniref:Uncharacterized protein n=1 Tax=Fusarium zealandicum TaxID=1053134 RepID=A0A8H4XPP1_9HYPO|nr:hypothetical protein FZEAL_1113 [Fusarium zealandicum]